MHEADPRTIAAAGRGDLDAFEELVRAFQADVWRFCASLLTDPSSADDVTQETFVRVFRFLPRYRGDSKFSTWLFSIARNCAMDEARRAQRRDRIQDLLRPEQSSVAPVGSQRLELREALADIPLELREPLLLIDMLGLRYREVAELLDAPVGTIKSRVHVARERLAAALVVPPEENAGER